MKLTAISCSLLKSQPSLPGGRLSLLSLLWITIHQFWTNHAHECHLKLAAIYKDHREDGLCKALLKVAAMLETIVQQLCP